MDEDIEYEYVDPRNAARVRVVRHPPANVRPPAAPRPVYQQPVYQQPVYQQPVYQQPVYQQAPVYYPRPVMMPARSTRIAELPLGDVLSLAAQAIAALQPLPAAPSAVGKADDDVQNLIVYQSALASHAKRDEQLRTLGAMVAKLLG